jgi:hypothetical protein
MRSHFGKSTYRSESKIDEETEKAYSAFSRIKLQASAADFSRWPIKRGMLIHGGQGTDQK